MKITDQYLKLVEWSEEDQCYVGSTIFKVGVFKQLLIELGQIIYTIKKLPS